MNKEVNLFYEDRRLGIGGSDMPIILGLSSYMSPYELYLQKLGMLEPKPETRAQYWGKLIEPLIRNEFAKKHNVTISVAENITHPVYSFLRANLDGYIEEWGAVFEAKCSNDYRIHSWGAEGTDGMPLSYLVQLAHYRNVKQAKYGHLMALHGDHSDKEYIYEVDHSLEDMLFNAAEAFWDCVKAETPPDASTVNDFKLKYQKTISTPIIATQDVLLKVGELFDVKRKIKELNEIENDYKLDIMKYMKDSDTLIDTDGTVLISWKANKNGSRAFLPKIPKE